MEEEVQIKYIAEEDRKKISMRPLKHLKLRKCRKDGRRRIIEKRDSSNMDQAREVFTHVGRPIILANNELAVVVDKGMAKL